MKKSLIALVFISLVTVALSGCASKESSEMAAQTGTARHQDSVPTGQFNEFCDTWDVGDNLKFSFTSTKPVLFNVHYHTAYDKFYPIKEVLTDEFSDSFVVQTKDVHCAMWTNKNDGFVKVTFEVEVINQ